MSAKHCNGSILPGFKEVHRRPTQFAAIYQPVPEGQSHAEWLLKLVPRYPLRVSVRRCRCLESGRKQTRRRTTLPDGERPRHRKRQGAGDARVDGGGLNSQRRRRLWFCLIRARRICLGCSTLQALQSALVAALHSVQLLLELLGLLPKLFDPTLKLDN